MHAAEQILCRPLLPGQVRMRLDSSAQKAQAYAARTARRALCRRATSRVNLGASEFGCNLTEPHFFQDSMIKARKQKGFVVQQTQWSQDDDGDDDDAEW